VVFRFLKKYARAYTLARPFWPYSGGLNEAVIRRLI